MLAPLRAGAFSLHVLLGLATVVAVFPWITQVSRNRINQQWSRILIAIAGARVMASGLTLTAAVRRDGVETTSGGRLVLANHISWLDIIAINAVLPSRFIAKAEIREWPVLGVLVSRSGTLYIERGRRHAVAAMNQTVREHLQSGETIVVFAEGTTTDGSGLLPFHSNLIAPAIDVGAAIWPLAIRYTERGERSSAAAYIGEMGILTSLAKVLVARRLLIEVAVLAPITTVGMPDRHAIARAARGAIANHLGVDEPTPQSTVRANYSS